MRVLVSGSSGLVGRALTAHLNKNGHETVALRRVKDAQPSGHPMWEPIGRQTWEQDIGAVDAVIHLAGENLASHRWTSRFKQRIRDSRVLGTEQLCRHLVTLREKPKTLIAASAIGYYGDRGEEVLTEDSAPGRGFLAEVCQDWEAACSPAAQAGIRVVNLRIGTVLAKEGGALAKLLTVYKLGLGGRLGSGRQWVSWLALDELVGIIDHAITDTSLTGPINAVSPNPVRNRELSQALARTIRRPAFLPVPSSVLRLAMGEMADSLLLASTRVKSGRLAEIGFQFLLPDLESALEDALLLEP